MADDRKHSRIPIKILGDIYTSDTRTPEGRGCIVNFSLGGVAVTTNLDLEPYTEIRMKSNLASEELDISGRITHGRAVMGDVFTYGVRYTRLNLFQKLKLRSRFKKWLKSQ